MFLQKLLLPNNNTPRPSANGHSPQGERLKNSPLLRGVDFGGAKRRGVSSLPENLLLT